MAKDHRNKKPSKNVFKVAGSRSFKAKNKPKAVSTQLKKLNEVNKKKLAEVDQQLNSLQEEVRQQPSKSTENKSKEASKLVPSEAIEQYKENEKKSAEALEKLTDMSMTS